MLEVEDISVAYGDLQARWDVSLRVDAGEIIVLLGPKWMAAAPVFRLLAPTILVFAVANPLGWLVSSLGLVKRARTQRRRASRIG